MRSPQSFVHIAYKSIGVPWIFTNKGYDHPWAVQFRLIIVSTVLSSWLDCPGWVVTDKQCMPHCTSLLICPSLVAQWLEHLPRLQKVSGSIPGLGKNFSTFVTSVARKSSGQLARKMIVVRPCINAWQRPWRSPASVGKLLKSLRGPLYIHKQGLQPPLSLSA